MKKLLLTGAIAALLSTGAFAKDIHVGNLPFSVDDHTLNEMFSKYGEVKRAQVVTDRGTGKSKGFGLVEMPNEDQALKAIDAFNEYELDGRQLKVQEAKPRG